MPLKAGTCWGVSPAVAMGPAKGAKSPPSGPILEYLAERYRKMSSPLGSCPVYHHSKSGFLPYYLPVSGTGAPVIESSVPPIPAWGAPATPVTESKTVRSPPRQCPQGRVVPRGSLEALP